MVKHTQKIRRQFSDEFSDKIQWDFFLLLFCSEIFVVKPLSFLALILVLSHLFL